MKNLVQQVSEVICNKLLELLNANRQAVSYKAARQSGSFMDGVVPTPALSGLSPGVTLELATESSLFIELGLGCVSHRILCMDLSEALKLPDIHSNFFRQIPLIDDIQDIPIAPNLSANFKLTVKIFAGKLATWLVVKHINVAQRIAA